MSRAPHKQSIAQQLINVAIYKGYCSVSSSFAKKNNALDQLINEMQVTEERNNNVKA